LYEVINVLPEKYRIILEMRFTKEFTLMEIGKIFKHSEAWASLQVTAAIKQIKIEISRGNYESLDNYGTKKERSNPERFKHNTGKSKNIKRGYKYEL
jgi:DNA-directed RNA polymerase specialized sigma subunit